MIGPDKIKIAGSYEELLKRETGNCGKKEIVVILTGFFAAFGIAFVWAMIHSIRSMANS